MLEDMVVEVEKLVVVSKSCVVLPKMECPGAECGCIFMELLTNEDSENLISHLTGKNYEKNDIKIVCVPEEAYVDFYLKQFEKKSV